MKTSIVIDTDENELLDQWHTLLHRLWSKAVGAPGYVKSEWLELERILIQTSHGPARTNSPIPEND